MKKQVLFIALGVAIFASVATAATARASDAAKPVKVFILAGQSNMEGKARNALLDYQAEAPDTKSFFAHLRKDGKWIVRDDVFIKFSSSFLITRAVEYGLVHPEGRVSGDTGSCCKEWSCGE
jgi:hypothetical protein